jgi:hypothetical protein
MNKKTSQGQFLSADRLKKQIFFMSSFRQVLYTWRQREQKKQTELQNEQREGERERQHFPDRS